MRSKFIIILLTGIMMVVFIGYFVMASDGLGLGGDCSEVWKTEGEAAADAACGTCFYCSPPGSGAYTKQEYNCTYKIFGDETKSAPCDYKDVVRKIPMWVNGVKKEFNEFKSPAKCNGYGECIVDECKNDIRDYMWSNKGVVPPDRLHPILAPWPKMNDKDKKIARQKADLYCGDVNDSVVGPDIYKDFLGKQDPSKRDASKVCVNFESDPWYNPFSWFSTPSVGRLSDYACGKCLMAGDTAYAKGVCIFQPDGSDIKCECAKGEVCNGHGECREKDKFCGDGEITFPENCEIDEDCAGVENSNGICNTQCKCEIEFCGDGIVSSGEQCDGDRICTKEDKESYWGCVDRLCNDPGTTNECKWAVCGNGNVEKGEQCDGSSGGCEEDESCIECKCVKKCPDADGDGYISASVLGCGGTDCFDEPGKMVEGAIQAEIWDENICNNGELDCDFFKYAACSKCVHPGAKEVCDNVDNNCGGWIRYYDDDLGSYVWELPSPDRVIPAETQTCEDGEKNCVVVDELIGIEYKQLEKVVEPFLAPSADERCVLHLGGRIEIDSSEIKIGDDELLQKIGSIKGGFELTKSAVMSPGAIRMSNRDKESADVNYLVGAKKRVDGSWEPEEVDHYNKNDAECNIQYEAVSKEKFVVSSVVNTLSKTSSKGVVTETVTDSKQEEVEGCPEGWFPATSNQRGQSVCETENEKISGGWFGGDKERVIQKCKCMNIKIEYCMPKTEDIIISSPLAEFEGEPFEKFKKLVFDAGLLENISVGGHYTEINKCIDGADNDGAEFLGVVLNSYNSEGALNTEMLQKRKVSGQKELEKVKEMFKNDKSGVKINYDGISAELRTDFSSKPIRVRDVDDPQCHEQYCVDKDGDGFCANFFDDSFVVTDYSTYDRSLVGYYKKSLSPPPKSLPSYKYKIDFLPSEFFPDCDDNLSDDEEQYSVGADPDEFVCCRNVRQDKLVSVGPTIYDWNYDSPLYFWKEKDQCPETEQIRGLIREVKVSENLCDADKKPSKERIMISKLVPKDFIEEKSDEGLVIKDVGEWGYESVALTAFDVHPFSSYAPKLCGYNKDVNCNKNKAEGYDYYNLIVKGRTPFDVDLNTGMEIAPCSLLHPNADLACFQGESGMDSDMKIVWVTSKPYVMTAATIAAIAIPVAGWAGLSAGIAGKIMSIGGSIVILTPVTTEFAIKAYELGEASGGTTRYTFGGITSVVTEEDVKKFDENLDYLWKTGAVFAAFDIGFAGYKYAKSLVEVRKMEKFFGEWVLANKISLNDAMLNHYSVKTAGGRIVKIPFFAKFSLPNGKRIPAEVLKGLSKAEANAVLGNPAEGFINLEFRSPYRTFSQKIFLGESTTTIEVLEVVTNKPVAGLLSAPAVATTGASPSLIRNFNPLSISSGQRVMQAAAHHSNKVGGSFGNFLKGGSKVKEPCLRGRCDAHNLIAQETAKATTGGCFLAGTKVLMADKTYKNIEDVVVGERVIAYDLEKQEPTGATVSHTFVRPESEYLIIKYEVIEA